MVLRTARRGILWCRTSLWLVGALGATSASGASILFVGDMDDAAFDAGNQSVVDRLETLGHQVEMADDNDATITDPTGKDLIIISSSSASTNILAYFTDEPIPIINWESALWDDLEMSDGGPNLGGQSAIDVLDIDHPLAVMMGLNQLGELDIREDVDTTFHGGNYAGLAPDATVVAEQVGGGAPLIAVVDEGGELRDGSLAADVRIGLFFGDQGLDGVTPEGVAIFDGAVRYAMRDTVGGPALQPGDADEDLDFDQLDIVKVQIAAKYLTGKQQRGARGIGMVAPVDNRAARPWATAGSINSMSWPHWRPAST